MSSSSPLRDCASSSSFGASSSSSWCPSATGSWIQEQQQQQQQQPQQANDVDLSRRPVNRGLSTFVFDAGGSLSSDPGGAFPGAFPPPQPFGRTAAYGCRPADADQWPPFEFESVAVPFDQAVMRAFACPPPPPNR